MKNPTLIVVFRLSVSDKKQYIKEIDLAQNVRLSKREFDSPKKSLLKMKHFNN